MDRFRDAFKGAGLKLTHQRLEIYQALAEAKDHPSAEMIFSRVRRRLPTISLDTVYRTIGTFERHGLLIRIPAFDDQGRFDADLSDHHHYVCDRCRGIMDFFWAGFNGLEPPPEARRWGRVDRVNVVVRGICRGCLGLAEPVS